METYHGHVRTPQDAIILFEACRLGVLPRVQRRLSEKERQQIRSGSVFVWDEREAGMRRWTDGKSWSASRVSGSFLTYREMEGKRGGSGFTPSQPAKKGTGAKSQDGSRSGEGEADGDSGEDGPEGYRYKQDGLMKQSFSITTNNQQHLHLISYYARLQPTVSPLKQPSTDPALRHIRPAKGMYPESTVNEAANVPAVTRGPMPGSPYASAPQQIAVAPPYPHAVPVGFPPGYPPPPPGWPPGGPVGPPYYYPHAPPHLLSPSHYAYHHPYGPPPPASTYERPPHLPPPATSAAAPPPGYPPGSRPPLPSALAHTSSTLGPNPYSSQSRPANLPSPGPPATSNGHLAALPPFSAANSKPLTPPPSGSTTASELRPHSSDASQAASQKVLPTIGALIHSDSPASAPGSSSGAEQRDANGVKLERTGSRSPGQAGGPGPQLRDLPSDKASCRQDMMAIAALDGRFNKPTTLG